jgi:hypothetical protein
MPVLDHPVHASTIAPPRYGCNGLPRTREPYDVPDGYTPDGRQQTSQIPDPLSPECRYDHSLTDTRCAGCQHRGSGEDYAEKYAEKIRKDGK